MKEKQHPIILNVDDTDAGRYVTSKILRNAGYEVWEAATGKEALELALKGPDLVILDVQLPDINGFEVCLQLKGNPKTSSIPILHLSATFLDDRSIVKGLEGGADAYLIQPVEPLVLVATAKALLRIRRAEAEAKASALKWQTTFDAIMDPIFLADQDANILQCNQAFASMADRPVGEIVGQKCFELLHVSPEFAKECFSAWIQGKHLREPLMISVGERRYKVTVDPVLDDAGKLVNTVHIMADITKQMRAESALAESEEKFRRIIESSPIGIKIKQNDRHVYVNPALVRMFGYDNSEEILGLSPEMLYTPEDRELIKQMQEDPKADALLPLSFEATGLKKDGTLFNVSVWKSDIHYQGEAAVVAFVIDVSSEKALRAQLNQAQKMEALGTLAGGVAHDFNNILGIIMGYSQLALIDLEEHSPLRNSLQEIMKASNRAKDLVQQILAFSRMSSQEKQPVQLSAVVNEALNLLRPTLPSTIEIRYTFHNEASTSMIRANPSQMHQLLMNLCTNAAHAMMEKGGTLELELCDVYIEKHLLTRYKDLPPGSYVRLTVSDTGHGMNADIVERIFDPFFTTKETGKGTGLGLAVVHGIVKSHEGVITVESEPGKGTTFKVFFPRIATEDIKTAEALKDAPTGNERILLVDDDKVLADVGRRMLEHLGYEVVTETDSWDALKTFRDQPYRFALVITDQTMPGMTGMGLSREILNIRHNMPIILCTGFSEEITEERVLAMGIRKLLMKPLAMANVATTVRDVLDEGR